MDRDRNLLFGVFAVQLKKATPSQIMAAAGAWASDQSRDLPSYLEDHGAISDAEKRLILGLVDHAVDAHEGDAAATLQRVAQQDATATPIRRAWVSKNRRDDTPREASRRAAVWVVYFSSTTNFWAAMSH